MGNREVEARYRQAHREEINFRKRLWHAENRERVNAKRRERYPQRSEVGRSRRTARCECPYCALLTCQGCLQRHVALKHPSKDLPS